MEYLFTVFTAQEIASYLFFLGGLLIFVSLANLRQEQRQKRHRGGMKKLHNRRSV